VLAIVAPLNAVVSKQSVKVGRQAVQYLDNLTPPNQITQDLMKCRDKRLGVMSELLGAIQVRPPCPEFGTSAHFHDTVYQVLCMDRQMEEASTRC
jgi:hypothetical protein